MIKLV